MTQGAAAVTWVAIWSGSVAFMPTCHTPCQVRSSMYWLKLFGILFSLYLLANIAYAVKSLAGVKLTNQPHHGWLFPIGDEIVKLCGGYPKRR